jgi:hypothetical protein
LQSERIFATWRINGPQIYNWGFGMATSFPNNPRPIFKPRELRTPETTQWYVEAEWADGTIDEIGQFKSISEAWDWIARQSRGWLEERGN